MQYFTGSIGSRTGALLAAFMAVIAAAGGHYSPAGACEIIAIKSADLKPYQEVLRGVKAASTCDLRELKIPGDDVAEQVLSSKPDAVVAVGTLAFKKILSISSLPVIHVMVMPSEADRFHGRNISGVSMDIPPERYFAETAGMFPAAKRIGLLYDPRFTGAYVADAERAAGAAGITLVTKRVHDPSSIPAALGDLSGKIDVLWLLPDPTVATSGAVELLLRHSFHANVPIIAFSRKYVEMGAVASLDAEPRDMGTQAGEIANRLVSGRTDPQRVFARKYQLTINRTVAAKMGLTISDESLRRAVTIE